MHASSTTPERYPGSDAEVGDTGKLVSPVSTCVPARAVYCGVPAANAASRVAQEVLVGLGHVEPAA